MASLAFQPFVDKENAGSIGARPNKGQTGGGLGNYWIITKLPLFHSIYLEYSTVAIWVLRRPSG